MTKFPTIFASAETVINSRRDATRDPPRVPRQLVIFSCTKPTRDFLQRPSRSGAHCASRAACLCRDPPGNCIVHHSSQSTEAASASLRCSGWRRRNIAAGVSRSRADRAVNAQPCAKPSGETSRLQLASFVGSVYEPLTKKFITLSIANFKAFDLGVSLVSWTCLVACPSLTFSARRRFIAQVGPEGVVVRLIDQVRFARTLAPKRSQQLVEAPP